MVTYPSIFSPNNGLTAPPQAPVNLDPNSVEYRKYLQDYAAFRKNNPGYVDPIGQKFGGSVGFGNVSPARTSPIKAPSIFSNAQLGGLISTATPASTIPIAARKTPFNFSSQTQLA